MTISETISGTKESKSSESLVPQLLPPRHLSSKYVFGTIFGTMFGTIFGTISEMIFRSVFGTLLGQFVWKY